MAQVTEYSFIDLYVNDPLALPEDTLDSNRYLQFFLPDGLKQSWFEGMAQPEGKTIVSRIINVPESFEHTEAMEYLSNKLWKAYRWAKKGNGSIILSSTIFKEV